MMMTMTLMIVMMMTIRTIMVILIMIRIMMMQLQVLPRTDLFVLLTNRVLITMMRPVLVMTVMNMILVNYLESGSKTCSLHSLRYNQI